MNIIHHVFKITDKRQVTIMREELKLDSIRSNLIRQEETIIFSMIERAQFCRNSLIYNNDGIRISGYKGSFMSFLLFETEQIHARVRRYTAPDEHPFSKELPVPYLTPMKYDWPIKKTDVNINDKILSLYFDEIMPLICKSGDDGNYGSSAVCDVNVLQALSKRIHYGKFVAESKFINDEKTYTSLIKSNNREKILELLTDVNIENQVLNRVEIKASTYGQDPLSKAPEFKINPAVIKDIYFRWIIPLTKEVEVLYLMERV
jgi:chorismate mutase